MSSNLPVWYPTQVHLRGAASSVHWQDLSGLPFKEAFFQHTVALAKDRLSQITPLGQTPPDGRELLPPPAAFIFHVSRCGSTLLCNILRAWQNTHVVAEPQPVVVLLAPFAEERWPYEAHEWERKRDQLLRQMVHRLGQAPLGGEGRYVVKLTSYSAMRMDLFRKLWPEVPIIFLVRNPMEVMLSNLSRPPAWMRLSQSPQTARTMFGWTEDSTTMTREEFGARVFGQLCHSAMLHRGAPSLVLEYEELLAGGWAPLGSLLGLDAPDAKEKIRIEQALRSDAKRGGEHARFEAQQQSQASPATAEIHAAAQCWALPKMQSLLAT